MIIIIYIRKTVEYIPTVNAMVLKYFRLSNVIHIYMLYGLVNPRNSNEFNLHKATLYIRLCIVCACLVHVYMYLRIFIDVSGDCVDTLSARLQST